MATIDARLLQDCELLGRFPLCHLLLMRDANYPWLVLVPDRDGVREIHHLEDADRQQLLRESVLVSALLEEQFRPDKLNVAALGNVVAQLHVHHIVRYRTDPAWPAPVWGRVPARPYAAEVLAVLSERLTGALAGCGSFTPDGQKKR
jgi:diadenosine tetraphosphate (Ap4A) HIT family hydrolase